MDAPLKTWKVNFFQTQRGNCPVGEYYLLHAFKKKSQKTPPKELKVAMNRMKGL